MDEAETFKAKLHNCEERIKDVANEIETLREHLAGKPKRRHGDVGIDFDKSKDGKLHFPVIAIKKGLGDSLDIIFRDGSPYSRRDEDDITWLGNIFDLLKEWSEDFENYYKNGIRLEESNAKDIFIQTGEWTHLVLSEAEEFWHALGQKIANLKRKSDNVQTEK